MTHRPNRRPPSMFETRRRAELYLDADDAKRATAPIEEAPTLARVRHPVIKAPQYKCYRVIRHFRQGGWTQFEDIGAFYSAVDAALMLAREEGNARVLDPRGKVFADNFQPIEER